MQANSQRSFQQKNLTDQEKIEVQERLRKVQEEIEKEKQRKADEEKVKKEMEENLRKKAEIESRRQMEEERLKQLEELSKRDLEFLKAEQLKEETRLREQMEQERRDHELALRLSKECNSQVEDFSSSYKLNHNQNNSNKKYDLSKWKYSDLRDTINTSCDIELQEACKQEFHRRLKVYHAWKAKNNKKAVLEENERAPKAIMEAANRISRLDKVTDTLNGSNSQRYFRVPFVRSAKNSSGNHENGVSHDQPNGKKGWWYAHFDGKYVARQMELHPDKAAILLVAGEDDMQMCDISLEETGLARKKGVEISEHEFEREWLKHGGKPYIRPYERVK